MVINPSPFELIRHMAWAQELVSLQNGDVSEAHLSSYHLSLETQEILIETQAPSGKKLSTYPPSGSNYKVFRGDSTSISHPNVPSVASWTFSLFMLTSCISVIFFARKEKQWQVYNFNTWQSILLHIYGIQHIFLGPYYVLLFCLVLWAQILVKYITSDWRSSQYKNQEGHRNKQITRKCEMGQN